MDDASDLDRLKIVIIRHGEKPKDGDNLTCGGFNRALQLPGVITAKFGVPDMVYIPQLIFGEHTYRMRMLQTITPLAVKYNLTINTNHLAEDYAQIAAELKTQTGTVLLCWEHKAIPFIAKALGVERELSWPSDDFDGIWIISFAQGKAILNRDAEGIKPGEDCGF